jgi:hypothetical protein
VVSLDVETAQILEMGLVKKLNPIMLVDVDGNYFTTPIPYRHIRSHPGEVSDGWLEELGDFILTIQASSPLQLPSALYLPPFASPEQEEDDEVRSIYTELLEACQKLGVEVVYEDLSCTWYLDSGFSEHFCARARKVREDTRKEIGY